MERMWVEYPRCSYCGKHGSDVVNVIGAAIGASPAVKGASWTGGLCKCPCETAFYCDANCQELHWHDHRRSCPCGQSEPTATTRCGNCGVISPLNMWCPCGTITYCSVECQREHWDTEHFEHCGPLQSSLDASATRSSEPALGRKLTKQLSSIFSSQQNGSALPMKKSRN